MKLLISASRFFVLFCVFTLIIGCQKKSNEDSVQTETDQIPKIRNLKVINASLNVYLKTNQQHLIAGNDGIVIISKEGTQWHAANTNGISDNIISVAADDSTNTILAGGENGLLMVSIDSGESWQKIATENNRKITAVAFDPANKKWIAMGEQGLALYSESPLTKWEKAVFNSGLTTTKLIPTSNSLLAIGEDGLMANSTDGGQNWQILESMTPATLTDGVVIDGQILIISCADGNILRIDLEKNIRNIIATGNTSYLTKVFYSTQHKTLIVSTSDGAVMLSDDTGHLWAPVAGTSGYLTNIAQTTDGSKTLVTGDAGTLMLSDNGGRTWQTLSSPTKVTIQGLATINQELVAYGESGLLLHSNAPDKSWITINFPFKEYLHQLIPVTADNWISVGTKGSLLRSRNQGQSWETTNAATQENDYLFSIIQDQKTGNLITAGTPGTILVSENQGKDWSIRLALGDITQGYFHQLIGDNKGTVVAIAGPGITHYSTDAGKTWQASNIDNTKQLFQGIYDVYSEQFIAVGQAGNIQLSRDAIDWKPATTSVQNSLQTLFAMENIIFIGADKGLILFSTDQGKNWQTIDTKVNATILSIRKLASGKLIAIGSKGLVLISADSGKNWRQISTPTTTLLRGPAQDPSTGIIYLSGKSGEILYSKDDAETWQLMPSVTQASIKSLYIDSKNHMLVGIGERQIRIPLLK